MCKIRFVILCFSNYLFIFWLWFMWNWRKQEAFVEANKLKTYHILAEKLPVMYMLLMMIWYQNTVAVRRLIWLNQSQLVKSFVLMYRFHFFQFLSRKISFYPKLNFSLDTKDVILFLISYSTAKYFQKNPLKPQHCKH